MPALSTPPAGAPQLLQVFGAQPAGPGQVLSQSPWPASFPRRSLKAPSGNEPTPLLQESTGTSRRGHLLPGGPEVSPRHRRSPEGNSLSPGSGAVGLEPQPRPLRGRRFLFSPAPPGPRACAVRSPRPSPARGPGLPRMRRSRRFSPGS